MSRSEDYLDQLLNGVELEEQEKAELEQDILDDNIFNDILEKLAEEKEEFLEEDFFSEEDFLDEDFLKEFEMEGLEEAGSEEDVLSLFNDLDNILNGEKVHEAVEELEEEPISAIEEPVVSVEEPAIEESVIEESVIEEPAIEEPAIEELAIEENDKEASVPLEINTAMEEGFSFANLFASEGAESKESAPEEDADVLKILEGLEGIDLELDEVDGSQSGNEQSDFSALEGFLAGASKQAVSNTDADTTSANDILSGFSFGENLEEATSGASEETPKKEKKAGEKDSFMSKLGLILFGEDDDDEEEELAMLEDSAKKAEKEQAKKEKKEKREKAKQERKEKREKAKLEKQTKAAEEKKLKPPKEPDNTPPLPKKPVFLIFLMVGSFIALVVMGADLLGYSNQMENAKNQYAKKNYSEAFAEIAGMEIKEEDSLLYNKYHVMAMVSAELEAYESLMSQEFYDMALDCLVRTVGRAEKYREDAETYGCIQELNGLEAKAEEILKETFDLSKEDALEIYAYRSKKEYSTAILKVIKEHGLEKVTK